MITQGGGPVSPPDLQPLVTSALIAFRLVISERHLRRAYTGAATSPPKGRWSLLPVARIVLDSAGAYAATLLTMLLLFLAGNTAFFIVMEAVVPVVALTFCGVIMRVAVHTSEIQRSIPARSGSLSQARHTESTPPSHERPSTQPISPARAHSRMSTCLRGKRSHTPENGLYEMPVVIRISTERISGISDMPHEGMAREEEEWQGSEEDAVKDWPFKGGM